MSTSTERIKKIRLNNYRWQTSLEDTSLLDVISQIDFNCPEQNTNIEVLKHDRTKDLVWAKLQYNEDIFFLKSRTFTKVHKRLHWISKQSSMETEWHTTRWAQKNNIPTIDPIAVAEIRHWRTLYRSIFVTRWEPDSITVKTYFIEQQKKLNEADFKAMKERLLPKLGGLFATIHKSNAYTSQYHGNNILIGGVNSDEPRLVLIDLAHLTITKSLSIEDWAWSFHLLPRWLNLVDVDRTKNSPDMELFMRGYYEVSSAHAKSETELFEAIRKVMPNSWKNRVPRRSRWFPNAFPRKLLTQ